MAIQLSSSGNSSAVAVLRRLIDTHASTLEARGVAGNTLLHCAAQAGSAELVTLLLSKQPALATTQNAAGARPHDLATCERVRALLRMACPPEPVDYHMHDVVENATAVDVDVCPSLGNLPEELQVHVLQHLDEPQHVLRMRESCRKLRAVADSDQVWERLCWTTYRRAARTSCLAGTWREIFIEHTLLQGGVKARQEQERTQRYLDRRSLAGLERLCRESVEAPAVLDLTHGAMPVFGGLSPPPAM